MPLRIAYIKNEGSTDVWAMKTEDWTAAQEAVDSAVKDGGERGRVIDLVVYEGDLAEILFSVCDGGKNEEEIERLLAQAYNKSGEKLRRKP